MLFGAEAKGYGTTSLYGKDLAVESSLINRDVLVGALSGIRISSGADLNGRGSSLTEGDRSACTNINRVGGKLDAVLSLGFRLAICALNGLRGDIT